MAGFYNQFVLETKTALGPQVDPENVFLLASNGDLVFVVRDDTTPGSPPATAVHILTAASGYQKFSLETKTALGPSNQPGTDFLLASNGDLVFVVRDDTTPGSPPATAVHILGPSPLPPAPPPPQPKKWYCLTVVDEDDDPIWQQPIQAASYDDAAAMAAEITAEVGGDDYVLADGPCASTARVSRNR
jgi:hypothetical protein